MWRIAPFAFSARCPTWLPEGYLISCQLLLGFTARFLQRICFSADVSRDCARRFLLYFYRAADVGSFSSSQRWK